jgi:hypothetical protein
MEIYKSQSPPIIVMLDASLSEYGRLAELINADLARGPDTPIELRSEYTLELEDTDQRLSIDLMAGKLFLKGGRSNVAWLSSYLSQLAASPGFGHLHIEWDYEHPYLSEMSIPLVVGEIA